MKMKFQKVQTNMILLKKRSWLFHPQKRNYWHLLLEKFISDGHISITNVRTNEQMKTSNVVNFLTSFCSETKSCRTVIFESEYCHDLLPHIQLVQLILTISDGHISIMNVLTDEQMKTSKVVLVKCMNFLASFCSETKSCRTVISESEYCHAPLSHIKLVQLILTQALNMKRSINFLVVRLVLQRVSLPLSR